MKKMTLTTYVLEFYDIESTAENNTIFAMTLQRPDIPLLMLHQPNDDVFFKIHKTNLIKFTVGNQKPRQIFYSIVDDELIEIKVRVPLLSQPENGGMDYQNIPEWWKDIKLVS